MFAPPCLNCSAATASLARRISSLKTLAESRRFGAPDGTFGNRAAFPEQSAGVRAAEAAIARLPDDVLIIFADTPLIRPQTLARMRQAIAQGAAVAVLGFRPRDPSGYGRLVQAGGELTAIREELDASAAERAIGLCNGGLMAL